MAASLRPSRLLPRSAVSRTAEAATATIELDDFAQISPAITACFVLVQPGKTPKMKSSDTFLEMSRRAMLSRKPKL
jgi:hypothetical protein